MLMKSRYSSQLSYHIYFFAGHLSITLSTNKINFINIIQAHLSQNNQKYYSQFSTINFAKAERGLRKPGRVGINKLNNL